VYDRREYAQGTFTLSYDNFGLSDAAALCPDGKVRKVRFYDGIADTFFSVPCRVSAYGKTVSGYITIETVNGYSTPTDDDPAIVKFVPYIYGKNGGVFNREA
jgi:hypothetical protein